jgi:hypothetical protein
LFLRVLLLSPVGTVWGADGSIVPPFVQVIGMAVLAGLLSPPADEKEATGHQGNHDNDESQDWNGDDNAELRVSFRR